MANLALVARQIIGSPKIILAADESGNEEKPGTIGKRLDSIGVPCTNANIHAYRRMLFSAKVGQFVGGAILARDTLACQELVDLLVAQGIAPGIKIDEGLEPFGDVAGEQVVKGFQDVEGRLALWRDQGAVFTKFRSLLNIVGDISPSASCIAANARAQAQFARKSQLAGLVPIVEPEIELVGNHSAERCEQVMMLVLKLVFNELARAEVDSRGMILKPAMVVSGKDATDRAGAEEVAERTLRALEATVHKDVPGIAFLSGGMDDNEADSNLDAINRLALSNPSRYPWRITASFGRGLQGAPLNAWRGDSRNVPAAQEAFRERCERTSAASTGRLAELVA